MSPVPTELSDSHLPTTDELLALFTNELSPEMLADLREHKLTPSEAFNALYAACLEEGLKPAVLFHQKGLLDE